MTSSVPVSAYGTWAGSPEEMPQMVQRVKMALASGFRHIDTAEIYGTKEYVFQAIQESGLPRDQIFLTSKVEPPPSAEDLRRGLGSMGYYDLLLLHQPPPAKTREEFKEKILMRWIQMHEYVELGLARGIGVSNFYRTQLNLLLEVCEEVGLYIPLVNQIEIHIGNLELEYVPYMKSLGIAVFAHTSLGGLAAKWLLEHEVLTKIATRLNATPAQVMISYLMGRGIAVVTSSKNVAHIREYFQAVELTEADMAAINESDDGQNCGRMIDGTQVAWEQELMLQ